MAMEFRKTVFSHRKLCALGKIKSLPGVIYCSGRPKNSYRDRLSDFEKISMVLDMDIPVNTTIHDGLHYKGQELEWS